MKINKFFIIILIVFLTFTSTNAWVWLFAWNWDILNISKWNEMITKLNTKLEQSNIIWTWNIDITNGIWNNVIVSFTWWLNSSPIPYITTTSRLIIPANSTKTINLNWDNFTPSSIIQIPWFDWTVNSVNVLSPYKIEANITAWSTLSDYDLIVSNNWVLNTQWSWNWVNLLHIWDILWTWVAWTYLEDFEAWMWSWVSSGLTWDWTRDSWWTPSSWTWPNNWAGWSTRYLYTEVSSWADKYAFWVETTDFRHATSVSLDYHMVWTNIWTIYVQTLYAWTWTTVWSLSWQQQANQDDAYINTWNIDLTWYQVESIRVLMNWATWWSWDIAFDNISITSD
jgi:hypothetical protein